MKKLKLMIGYVIPVILVACGGGEGVKTSTDPSEIITPHIIEPLKDNQAILGLQEPYSLVSMSPSIIQIATYPLNQTPNTVHASQLFYELDSDLNLKESSGKVVNTLNNFLNMSRGQFLIVVKIYDLKTIQALEELNKSVDLNDITVISEDRELLKTIHSLTPKIRTGLDLRKETYLTNQPKDLLSIAESTNQSFARFVILPKSLNSKNNVSFIQRLLVSVWVENDNSYEGAAQALTTGANGVMTRDSTIVAQVLQQFPANTLLRKPLIIGHRGVPFLEDENTLESAKKAVLLGADAIENDIYITKDNHLVIMHDSTVDRTTNGHGPIENMTLDEVKSLSTKNKGYRIPTLEEYFQAFKSNKNVIHFIELKSNNPLIVPRLKEEISNNAVDDQVVTISFHPEQISRMKNLLPGVSTGYLTGTPNLSDQKENVKKILEITQSLSVTFNPSYANNLIQLMEATKHRGITVWPWTIDDEKAFKQLYVSGVYGITTDYTQYASKYVVDLQTQPIVSIHKDEILKLSVQLTRQDGTNLGDLANQFIVLPGSPQYTFKNGNIQFKESGTFYVLPGYKYQIDPHNFYQIFSKPIKIIVN